MDGTNTLSFESKLQQLLDRVDNGLDKSEGSIIYDALAPIAMQLWIEESKFRSILEQAFAVTAEGRFLDLIAKDYGLERTPAAAAWVELTFTGIPDAVIPEGTTVGIENSDISYATTAEAVIGSQGKTTVTARCKQPGVIGNVKADTIRLLFDPVKDIWTVNHIAPAAGGLNQESDESLRGRILYQKRNPEHGGTESDYKRWALSVTGVTYAEAINCGRGLGTVDVVVGADGDLEHVCLEVRKLIELKKPLGVDVIVKPVIPEPMTVKVKVIGLNEAAAKNAVYAYLRKVDIGGTIYLSKIVAALIAAGAEDASILEPKANLELPIDRSLQAEVIIV
ncbi:MULTISPECIES: baseplate J/gp47 family protein [unclassified Paenibacillus]|uniref:baseplate J/gp47 family protein n=1 Tax=unclassified Paenibacillus TaxID=185978 RepID=UPI00104A87E2|nr:MULTISPECIES: baseplate J/gp47 family protein [unclassified Paenibacillus]NIK67106.1 putative phage protein gp47/JayE [Paenibacillus sp. BK720]TCN01155.1 putative phage protein gp47/JayE [Paenibacillus sp. BK033]